METIWEKLCFYVALQAVGLTFYLKATLSYYILLIIYILLISLYIFKI